MLYGYELNVNNEVWGGIHWIFCLLPDDENVNAFFEMFDNYSCKQAHFFEVKGQGFLLQITIDEFYLKFLLTMNENESTFYEVNFADKDENIENEDLTYFEELHEKFISLLEDKNTVYKTKFEAVK